MSEAGVNSRTGVRVATAAVLLPVVVAAVWWGRPWLVAALVFVVTGLALWEFFALAEKLGLRGDRVWTVLCALGVIGSQWSAAATKTFDLPGDTFLVAKAGKVPLELILLVFVLGLAAGAVGGKRALAEILPSIGISGAGLLFVALPLSYAVRLHGVEDGRLWLLFTLTLVWVGDTVAYFVGRSMGRLKMAPQISPKKTWEGAAGNLLGSLLVAAVFSRWIRIEVTHVVAMAALANVAGQVGDLVESAYKRGAGVKDSGGLLPGHGGMLDRIDALIFAAPAVWAYLSFVV